MTVEPRIAEKTHTLQELACNLQNSLDETNSSKTQ
jgi:hypothetical protein